MIIDFEPNTKVSQQQGWRIHFQLQETVQDEVERLLNEGHIKRVTVVTDKEFIQPVVTTFKTRQKC